MIKSNLSRTYTFHLAVKKSRWKILGHGDNYLQLHLHITNSENKSTVKIHFLLLLILLQTTEEVSEDASSQDKISLSTQEPHLSVLYHLYLWNRSSNHANVIGQLS